MSIDEVMNALGGAGQLLVASVVAVILLILLLWILVPLTVLGLRGRVSDVRDDQRRVLAAIREQQRTLNEMLGALIEEQQVTNDILARFAQSDDVEELPRAARSATPPQSQAASETAPPLDGRATDRGVRPTRPLVADR